MSTEEAVKALGDLKEYVKKNTVDDPVSQLYYVIAIDTAVREIQNYEQLLEKLLSRAHDELNRLQHEYSLNNLRFKIYREGGNIP